MKIFFMFRPPNSYGLVGLYAYTSGVSSTEISYIIYTLDRMYTQPPIIVDKDKKNKHVHV